MRWRPVATALAVSCALLAIPASAPAADAIYWTNLEGAPVSYANLDGGGAGDLALTGVVSSMPTGLTLDPADGKLFFSNAGTESIQWAYLDGSGGGQVNTAPVGLGEPSATRGRPAAGRVYWSSSNRIAYAKTDGSGAAVLNTTGATIEQPGGLRSTPPPVGSTGRTSNSGCTKVSYANLNGTGGGDLSKSPVPNNGTGVALDPRSGRVFWSVLNGTIESSNTGRSGVVESQSPRSDHSGSDAVDRDRPADQQGLLDRGTGEIDNLVREPERWWWGRHANHGREHQIPQQRCDPARAGGNRAADDQRTAHRAIDAHLLPGRLGARCPRLALLPGAAIVRLPVAERRHTDRRLHPADPHSGELRRVLLPGHRDQLRRLGLPDERRGERRVRERGRGPSGHREAGESATVSLRCQGAQERCKGTFSLIALPPHDSEEMATRAIPAIRYSA